METTTDLAIRRSMPRERAGRSARSTSSRAASRAGGRSRRTRSARDSDGARPQELHLELREGGRFYERSGRRGASRGAACSPTTRRCRIVIEWHVNPANPATEIEVTLHAGGRRHAASSSSTAAGSASATAGTRRAPSYDGENGWTTVLGLYAEAATLATRATTEVRALPAPPPRRQPPAVSANRRSKAGQSQGNEGQWGKTAGFHTLWWRCVPRNRTARFAVLGSSAQRAAASGYSSTRSSALRRKIVVGCLVRALARPDHALVPLGRARPGAELRRRRCCGRSRSRRTASRGRSATPPAGRAASSTPSPRTSS